MDWRRKATVFKGNIMSNSKAFQTEKIFASLRNQGNRREVMRER